MPELRELGGERVLLIEADGPVIDSETGAADLIGEAMGHDASIIAVPVSRLGATFFQLRSGLAGAIVQKFVNYRFRLAVIGDITEHLAESAALRDWVRESNRGSEVSFLPSFDNLVERLGRPVLPGPGVR